MRESRIQVRLVDLKFQKMTWIGLENGPGILEYWGIVNEGVRTQCLMRERFN